MKLSIAAAAVSAEAPLPMNITVTVAAVARRGSVLALSARAHQQRRYVSSNTPLSQYDRLIEAGALRAGDEHQHRVVRLLDELHQQLKSYDPPQIESASPSPKPSIFSRLFSKSSTVEPAVKVDNAPQGLYLHGSVGTGKTMLMDLFYNTLPSKWDASKRRAHFHAFMVDVHKRVHAVNIKSDYNGGDQVGIVARDIAREARVLCFDEFQVTDITDAMILGRLVESLLEHGVVCVFTSNRHPDELYKNGIQRSSFLPTIELLKTRFKVTPLDSGTDYRQEGTPIAADHSPYHHPLNTGSARALEKVFEIFAPGEKVSQGRKLPLWGRSLRVPYSTEQVAKFTFHDLCDSPLSASDYLTITGTFGTLVVENIPKMGLNERDMARRFINLIDACYENKTRLILSSEVPIVQVFSDDVNDTDKANRSYTDHQRAMMDDLGLNPEIVGSSSIFSGDEELFAFARACSRLVQMESKEWAEIAGNGGVGFSKVEPKKQEDAVELEGSDANEVSPKVERRATA